VPRVSKPGDFGLGGAKLREIPIGQRRARASPEAFGYGRSVESFGGGLGPDAFGAGRNLESFGGGVAPEAYGSGQALISQETEGQALSAYLSVKRRDEITQANADSLKARGTYWEEFDQRQTARADGDPGEFTKDELSHFDEWKAAQLEGQTGFRRQVLEQDFGQLRMSVQGQASQFEGTRRRQYREEQQKIVYDQTLEAAGSARNAAFTQPGDLGALQQQQLRTIEATDLPEDVKAKLSRTVNGALADAAWQGRVQKDPYSVKAALERGDPAELQGLEFDDRAQIIGHADAVINGIEAEQRRLASEARAEANRRRSEAQQEQMFRLADMQDQVAAVNDAAAKGLPIEGAGSLMTQIVKEAHGAMSPAILTRSQRLAEHLNLAITSSAYARDFATKPVVDQMAELEALRTTAHAPDDLPLAAAKYEIAGKVIKANVDAINEGHFLQRANELGVVKLEPLDLTDPGSIAKRVDDSKMASAFLGSGAVSTQLFTKDELAAEAKRFAGMAGEERANYMAKLQAAAGDQYPEIMRQLTAKGGLDRASQYISILSGRPDAAPVMNAVGEAMSAKPEELKVNLIKSGWSEADVDRSVEKGLRQWMSSVGQTYVQGATGASAMQADVFDMVKNTSLVLMRTHSPAEAVRLATDQIINERYEFRDGYRIPKPARNAADYIAGVDLRTRNAVANLTPDSVDPKGSAQGVDEITRRAGYVEAVKNRHQWVTLPDESALVLTDEQGSVVTERGVPVIVKFGPH
jgi:hypothetical protein